MTRETPPIPFVDGQLVVRRWRREHWHAHPIDSEYADLWWLPVVGASSIAMVRYCDHVLRRNDDDPFVIHPDALGHALGAGAGRSLLTIKRLLQFRLIDVTADALLFPSHYPDVPPRNLARVPAWLRQPTHKEDPPMLTNRTEAV